MIVQIDLLVGSESDQKLQAKCGDMSAPFMATEKHGRCGVRELVRGRATHLRRAVGRKHGKVARYWVEVVPS